MGMTPLPDIDKVHRLTQEFLAETFEGLDRMDRCLTELELRPRDRELIGEIFRVIHTIKGATGFLGFRRLERVAHACEHVMNGVRTGQIEAGRAQVSGLLRGLDGMRLIARGIVLRGGEEPAAGDRGGDGSGDGHTGGDELLSGKEGEDCELLQLLEGLFAGGVEAGVARETGARALPAPGSDGLEESAAWRKANDSTLRVEAAVLNRMMNLVGELILTRNQFLQKGLSSSQYEELTRRLDYVTGELRTNVMDASVQPLAQIFGRFPRMVRDLALQCGKQVRLELSGQETGLDKSLLEAIRDPLAHALRNAIDHGIEHAEQRVQAGKPAQGVVRLKAYQSSGWVVIELEDDGAGVSRRRVLERAIERRLVTRDEASAWSAREVLRLLFEPGFSTAQGVTVMSGRGVGLDVVRSNVERVGGSVEIESREGVGTLVRMRMPFTLAIVPAFIVRSGDERYCIPERGVAEVLFRPWAPSPGMPVAREFSLRGRRLPLLWLDRILTSQDRILTNQERILTSHDRILTSRERAVMSHDRAATQQDRPGANPESTSAGDTHGCYVAVLETEKATFGLALSDLMASEEIVVKSLSAGLREIGVFSGATILGTGEVALILDLAALSAMAQMLWLEQGSELAPEDAGQAGPTPGWPGSGFASGGSKLAGSGVAGPGTQREAESATQQAGSAIQQARSGTQQEAAGSARGSRTATTPGPATEWAGR